jgi:hypothetical protein
MVQASDNGGKFLVDSEEVTNGSIDFQLYSNISDCYGLIEALI